MSCFNEFLNDTDGHFQKFKIVNLDMINNDLSQKKIQQYQTIDHDKIKQYSPNHQETIRSSIFRNAKRKNMDVQKTKRKYKNIFKIIMYLLIEVEVVSSKKLKMICMPSVGNLVYVSFLIFL